MNNLAVAYRRAGKYAEAEPLSREALAVRLKKLSAEIPANDWQRLHERGELYARGGQWQKAAADYAAAIKAHPEDHVLWYQAAAIWLEAGDQDAYRRHCQEMLRRFGETDDPTIAERTAKICLLIPVASADLSPRVRLAERAVTGTEEHKYYRYFLLARALAHYRAGRIRPRHGDFWTRALRREPRSSTPSPRTLSWRWHITNWASGRKPKRP